MRKEQLVFRDFRELAAALSPQQVTFKVIGLDGEDGCGKSGLAKQLSHELRIRHVEVDRFLDKNKGAYVPFIKVNELKQQLDEAISAAQSVIVEGVCLLAVLDRLGVRADIFIYMKRLGPQGIWYSEDLLAPDEHAGDPLERIRRTQAASLGRRIENHQLQRKLEVEIVEYHQKYRPAQVADYVFERLEEP